jgi:hypothetical protein
MTKDNRQEEQIKNVDGGAHLGGTRFGQVPGDAKEKDGHQGGPKGDKARPNDGKTS